MLQTQPGNGVADRWGGGGSRILARFPRRFPCLKTGSANGNGFREEMPDALLTPPLRPLHARVWSGVWDMGKDPALRRTQIRFTAQPPAIIEKVCVAMEMGRACVLGCHWLGPPRMGI